VIAPSAAVAPAAARRCGGTARELALGTSVTAGIRLAIDTCRHLRFGGRIRRGVGTVIGAEWASAQTRCESAEGGGVEVLRGSGTDRDLGECHADMFARGARCLLQANGGMACGQVGHQLGRTCVQLGDIVWEHNM
jgi:hypothetical protein